MIPVHVCRIWLGLVSIVLLCAASDRAQAQFTRGFDTTVAPVVTSQELRAQPRLWVLEVSYKPMRMIIAEITDRKTGEKKRQFIWYLVYRVVNRPLRQLEDASETATVNQFDGPPGPPIFAPSFTLLTDDGGVQVVYEDEILPEAQAAIMRRERQVLKNSVEVVGPIPPIAESGAPEAALYGVAMWSGVDLTADFFTVIMSGLSNGYMYVQGPVPYDQLRQLAAEGKVLITDQVWDGQSDWIGANELDGLFDEKKAAQPNTKESSWYYAIAPDRVEPESLPPIWRKTLIQKYWRPGDELDPDETEIRAFGDPRWVYRADDMAGLSTLPAAPVDKTPGKKPVAVPKRPLWETQSPAGAKKPADKPKKDDAPPVMEPGPEQPKPPTTVEPKPAAKPPAGGSSILGDFFKKLDRAAKQKPESKP